MYINFKRYELAQPNNCEVNYIDIYGEILSEDKRVVKFCGTATEPQKSEANIINIRYHAKPEALSSPTVKFEIIFTAYREWQDPKGEHFIFSFSQTNN